MTMSTSEKVRRSLGAWAHWLGVNNDTDAISLLRRRRHWLDLSAASVRKSYRAFEGCPDTEIQRALAEAFQRIQFADEQVRPVLDWFARHERGNTRSGSSRAGRGGRRRGRWS